MAEATELITLPEDDTKLAVFSTPNGLDPYLQRIIDFCEAFEPDLSTVKGRKEIASMAHKVAKAKTALDDMGKELVADLKELPKLIDAERKRMRDRLDTLKDEVRAPLTRWEKAEEERQQRHRVAIDWFRVRAEETQGLTADVLRAGLAEVEARIVDESWEEFQPEAEAIQRRAIESLRRALVVREQYDTEQAELARLRAEKAERERKDHEERIAREAREKAQREADAAAQAERNAAARREAEAAEAVKTAKFEAQLAEERRIAAEKQAELDRRNAEAREREAAAEAERREKAAAEQAAAAERQRIADEQAAADAEAKRREADLEHKASINRAALNAFVMGGMPEDCAKQAVTLVAKGLIPNIRITY